MSWTLREWLPTDMLRTVTTRPGLTVQLIPENIMSDHPTVPQPEANFMAAAERAIENLQLEARSAADAAAVAKSAAYRAEASARRWRKLTLVLGFAIALLVATAAVTGYFVNQTR